MSLGEPCAIINWLTLSNPSCASPVWRSLAKVSVKFQRLNTLKIFRCVQMKFECRFSEKKIFHVRNSSVAGSRWESAEKSGTRNWDGNRDGMMIRNELFCSAVFQIRFQFIVAILHRYDDFLPL